jgi:glycosyltransferase involved in cell wall biosynthesis
MRVLYLTYDGLTDPLGQSQIIPYMVGLAETGIEFTIVSFEKRSNFKKNRDFVRRTLTNNIKWIPLNYHKRPPVFSTLWDLTLLWFVVQKQNRKSKFDIVHCRSYITSLVGLRAKRKWGIKFIFDMRGFWADERVEGGLWNLENSVFRSIYQFFKQKEKTFVTEAHCIVSLTENGKKEIESWKLQNAPIVVIPTCVDTTLFDPEKIDIQKKKLLRAKLSIDSGDFVLLYLGSWGTWYLTEEMLSFFSILKQQKPKAKFLIVSMDKIDLGDYQHKDDVIITSAKRSEVPLFVSQADCAIFFIKPSYSKKASSATKMGEMMAMRIPIVTNCGWGDAQQILKDYTNSQIIQSFSSEEMSKVVTVLSSDPVASAATLPEALTLEYGTFQYKRIYAQMSQR